jgi:hypothetical protein
VPLRPASAASVCADQDTAEAGDDCRRALLEKDADKQASYADATSGRASEWGAQGRGGGGKGDRACSRCRGQVCGRGPAEDAAGPVSAGGGMVANEYSAGLQQGAAVARE